MTGAGPKPEEAPAQRRAAAGKMSDLRPRLISSFGLGLAAAFAIGLGGPVSALLVAAAAAAMGWELRSIVAARSGGFARRDLFAPAVMAAAPLAAHVAGGLEAAFALLALGAAAALVLDGDGRDRRFTVPGLVIIGAAAASFVYLRDQPRFGFEAVLWLVLVVAATDIGGYFAGRSFGGPRLAPTLSPGKTWSGLAGGLALAALVGGLFSWATTGTTAEEVCVVSVVAAFVAVAGDLAESALKRRFGVKDASRLIPGHGGVLDRVDGLMAATLVAAAVTAWRGKEVFVW